MLAALVLGACASEPQVGRSGGPGNASARKLLAETAEAGPVPAVILGAPATLSPTRSAQLAAQGISGLDVRFTPVVAPPPGPHLVLMFDPSPALTGRAACTATEADGAISERPRLAAVFCSGDEPVGEVQGTAAGTDTRAIERLVWQSTSRLFPDDYADTYGLNLFGWRVTLGGSFGF
jgi:hypothetical protein